ncbi:MAG: hypothetical protein AAFZ58_09365 [Pseudomonadota bacterium]
MTAVRFNKTIALAAVLVVLSTTLSACQIVEKWIVTNKSAAPITLVLPNREVVIEPDERARIRGLHHVGFSIRYATGKTIDYSESAAAILDDWERHFGSYICSGLSGSTVKADVTDGNAVLLMPCDVDDAPLALEHGR